MIVRNLSIQSSCYQQTGIYLLKSQSSFKIKIQESEQNFKEESQTSRAKTCRITVYPSSPIIFPFIFLQRLQTIALRYIKPIAEKKSQPRRKGPKSGIATIAELVLVYDGKIRHVTSDALDLVSYRPDGKVCFAGRYLIFQTDDKYFNFQFMNTILDTLIHGFCPKREGCILDGPESKKDFDWFSRLT